MVTGRRVLPARKVIIAILAIAAISLAGCAKTGSDQKDAPAKLSKEEKAELIAELKPEVLEKYTNDQGLIRLYSQIANNSKRKLISAEILATNLPVKGEFVSFGKTVVEDVKAGETKTFEIATGKGVDEAKQQIVLTIKKADFK